jgi:nitrite reductase (NO-forming)
LVQPEDDRSTMEGTQLSLPAAPIRLEPVGSRPIRRDGDRRVALASIVAAGGFIAGAAGLAVAQANPWIPLHLLLAGAAATAIAGVLPFFASALAAARPAPARVRLAAVVLVAGGAVGVASRTTGAPGWLAPLGGVAFLAGIGLVAVMTASAIRAGLGARRRWVAVAYAAAVGNVAVGAGLATLFVAGFAPVLGAWGMLRPAHAWLNLVGFVSLVVVGTLLHLLPTVAGTRIVERPSGRLAVAGLAGGAPLVALGLAVAGAGQAAVGDVLTRLGALLALVAAAAVVAEAAAVLRARGRWTTDLGWHAMATGSLVAAIAWFAVGLALAAARALWAGAAPIAWSTELIVAPLAVGWVVQVIVGAWSHLVPAIGPRGPDGHAARRRILGYAAVPRLVALNAGVALVALGWTGGVDVVIRPGVVLVGGSVAADLLLGLAAVAVRPARVSGPARAG